MRRRRTSSSFSRFVKPPYVREPGDCCRGGSFYRIAPGRMETNQVHAELEALSVLVDHPEIGADIRLAADILAAQSKVALDPGAEAIEDFLVSELEAMPKAAGAWWMPPRNVVLNQTLLGGFNLWRFTILPLFPERRAYSEKLGGIVIHPIWRPLGSQTLELTLDTAKNLVAGIRKSPTVQDDVRKEIDWIEKKFSIRVPEAVVAKLVKDALPTARRRWNVDRLRVKDRLIPLDPMMAPRDLDSLEAR